ncbi:MAG: hypothetical protein ACRDTH_23260 [Pseudonocardiaceae bacterium]
MATSRQLAFDRLAVEEPRRWICSAWLPSWWTITQQEGTTNPPSGTQRQSAHEPSTAVRVASLAARRAGPREHGRQAARSKRDRPETASELYQVSHLRAAAGGVLIH